MCCLLVLNLVSSTLSCIRQPRPRLKNDAASATEEEDWEEDNERSERSCAEPVVDYIKQRNRVLLRETVTRFPKEPRC